NTRLHDQRQAMRWLHEHIEHFGGDPSKVLTLVGESAGSISISQHLLANGGNTERLFRAPSR
ncbi:Carboxylesterase, partial [Athelia psychrophila]